MGQTDYKLQDKPKVHLFPLVIKQIFCFVTQKTHIFSSNSTASWGEKDEISVSQKCKVTKEITLQWALPANEALFLSSQKKNDCVIIQQLSILHHLIRIRQSTAEQQHQKSSIMLSPSTWNQTNEAKTLLSDPLHWSLSLGPQRFQARSFH